MYVLIKREQISEGHYVKAISSFEGIQVSYLFSISLYIYYFYESK
jgi:hypothetical protein